jgi:hypothetical protein
MDAVFIGEMSRGCDGERAAGVYSLVSFAPAPDHMLD